jgi:hypothetical protein
MMTEPPWKVTGKTQRMLIFAMFWPRKEAGYESVLSAHGSHGSHGGAEILAYQWWREGGGTNVVFSWVMRTY